MSPLAALAAGCRAAAIVALHGEYLDEPDELEITVSWDAEGRAQAMVTVESLGGAVMCTAQRDSEEDALRDLLAELREELSRG